MDKAKTYKGSLNDIEFSGTDEKAVREHILKEFKDSYEEINHCPFRWSAMGRAENNLRIDVIEDGKTTITRYGFNEIKRVDIPVCDGYENGCHYSLRVTAIVETCSGLEWAFIEYQDGETFYLSIDEDIPVSGLADYLNMDDNEGKGYSCGSWDNLEDAIDYFIEDILCE